MTRERTAEERISDWLLEEAPDQLPDRVLQATFEQTRPSRQRRTFLGRRANQMRSRTTTAIAVGAAAIVLLVIGVTQLPGPNASVGGDPSPSPTSGPTPSPRPTPSPSPTLAPVSLTGQIAFARSADGNTDIYLMNLDRTGLVRLTTDPLIDEAPSWSADGQRIVFTRGSGAARDVFVVNADGTGEARLTVSPEGEDSAAFSPDGSEIVFLRYVDPTYFDIFVMDSDGSNQRRVWHKDGVFANGPRWSPDGEAIYFNEDESAGGGIDIVRLDLTTNELTRIAAAPGDDSTFDISSDGSTVAFQSDRSPGGIFLMAIDGSNVRHLTGAWTKGYAVSWSPDGAHLVYSQPDGWLYLVPADGGEVIRWSEGGLTVAWRPAP
jgi:Tol biopolymer transport system component